MRILLLGIIVKVISGGSVVATLPEASVSTLTLMTSDGKVSLCTAHSTKTLTSTHTSNLNVYELPGTYDTAAANTHTRSMSTTATQSMHTKPTQSSMEETWNGTKINQSSKDDGTKIADSKTHQPHGTEESWDTTKTTAATSTSQSMHPSKDEFGDSSNAEFYETFKDKKYNANTASTFMKGAENTETSTESLFMKGSESTATSFTTSTFTGMRDAWNSQVMTLPTATTRMMFKRKRGRKCKENTVTKTTTVTSHADDSRTVTERIPITITKNGDSTATSTSTAISENENRKNELFFKNHVHNLKDNMSTTKVNGAFHAYVLPTNNVQQSMQSTSGLPQTSMHSMTGHDEFKFTNTQSTDTTSQEAFKLPNTQSTQSTQSASHDQQLSVSSITLPTSSSASSSVSLPTIRTINFQSDQQHSATRHTINDQSDQPQSTTTLSNASESYNNFSTSKTSPTSNIQTTIFVLPTVERTAAGFTTSTTGKSMTTSAHSSSQESNAATHTSVHTELPSDFKVYTNTVANTSKQNSAPSANVTVTMINGQLTTIITTMAKSNTTSTKSMDQRTSTTTSSPEVIVRKAPTLYELPSSLPTVYANPTTTTSPSSIRHFQQSTLSSSSSGSFQQSTPASTPSGRAITFMKKEYNHLDIHRPTRVIVPIPVTRTQYRTRTVRAPGTPLFVPYTRTLTHTTTQLLHHQPPAVHHHHLVTSTHVIRPTPPTNPYPHPHPVFAHPDPNPVFAHQHPHYDEDNEGSDESLWHPTTPVIRRIWHQRQVRHVYHRAPCSDRKPEELTPQRTFPLVHRNGPMVI